LDNANFPRVNPDRHKFPERISLFPRYGWQGLLQEYQMTNQNNPNEKNQDQKPGQQQGGNPRPGQQQQQPGQGGQQGGQKPGQGGQQNQR
jgi:hypothetical protein